MQERMSCQIQSTATSNADTACCDGVKIGCQGRNGKPASLGAVLHAAGAFDEREAGVCHCGGFSEEGHKMGKGNHVAGVVGCTLGWK